MFLVWMRRISRRPVGSGYRCQPHGQSGRNDEAPGRSSWDGWCSHDDDVGASLEAVHEGQELRDDTTLNLAVGLVTLGRNRVNLIDEDDGGAVLLGLLEGLAKVGLGLSGHLGHDLGTVDKEEEGAGLVGDSTSHQGLAGTGGSKHQDTARRLDADSLEELRVAERKLNELTNLRDESAIRSNDASCSIN
jgi:hypothetical protein